jgi:hypothetical protein
MKGRDIMAAGYTIMINGEWLRDIEGMLIFSRMEIVSLFENITFNPGTDIHIYANDRGYSTNDLSEWCRKKAAILRQEIRGA